MSMSMPQIPPHAGSGSGKMKGFVSVANVQDKPIPGLRAALDEKSMTELRNVLEDVAALHEFISSLSISELMDLQQRKQAMAAESRNAALQNLDLKPELVTAEETMTLRCSEVSEQMGAYKERYAELNQLVKELDNETLFTQLRSSGDELENQTDKIAEDLMAGNMREDEFLDQYLQHRTQYWLKKVKAEKMDELLHSKSAKQAPPPRPTPYCTKHAAVTKASTIDGGEPSQQLQPPSVEPRRQSMPQQQSSQPPPYLPPISAAQGPPYQQPPQGAPAQPRPPYQAPPGAPYQAPPRAPYQAPPRAPYQAPPRAPYQAPPRAPYQAPPRAPYQAPAGAPYQQRPPYPPGSYRPPYPQQQPQYRGQPPPAGRLPPPQPGYQRPPAPYPQQYGRRY